MLYPGASPTLRCENVDVLPHPMTNASLIRPEYRRPANLISRLDFVTLKLFLAIVEELDLNTRIWTKE